MAESKFGALVATVASAAATPFRFEPAAIFGGIATGASGLLAWDTTDTTISLPFWVTALCVFVVGAAGLAVRQTVWSPASHEQATADAAEAAEAAALLDDGDLPDNG